MCDVCEHTYAHIPYSGRDLFLEISNVQKYSKVEIQRLIFSCTNYWVKSVNFGKYNSKRFIFENLKLQKLPAVL